MTRPNGNSSTGSRRSVPPLCGAGGQWGFFHRSSSDLDHEDVAPPGTTAAPGSRSLPRIHPRHQQTMKSFVDGIVTPFVACVQPHLQACVSPRDSGYRREPPPSSPTGRRSSRRHRDGQELHGTTASSEGFEVGQSGVLQLNDIAKPSDNDVLCGKGCNAVRHRGNIIFRDLTAANSSMYSGLTKKQKMYVAQQIVDLIRCQQPPGRFLSRDAKTGLWSDIGTPRSLEKTSQALRDQASPAGGTESRNPDRPEDALSSPETSRSQNACHTTTNPRDTKTPQIVIPPHLRRLFRYPTNSNWGRTSYPPSSPPPMESPSHSWAPTLSPRQLSPSPATCERPDSRYLVTDQSWVSSEATADNTTAPVFSLNPSLLPARGNSIVLDPSLSHRISPMHSPRSLDPSPEAVHLHARTHSPGPIQNQPMLHTSRARTMPTSFYTPTSPVPSPSAHVASHFLSSEPDIVSPDRPNGDWRPQGTASYDASSATGGTSAWSARFEEAKQHRLAGTVEWPQEEGAEWGPQPQAQQHLQPHIGSVSLFPPNSLRSASSESENTARSKVMVSNFNVDDRLPAPDDLRSRTPSPGVSRLSSGEMDGLAALSSAAFLKLDNSE